MVHTLNSVGKTLGSQSQGDEFKFCRETDVFIWFLMGIICFGVFTAKRYRTPWKLADRAHSALQKVSTGWASSGHASADNCCNLEIFHIMLVTCPVLLSKVVNFCDETV